MTCLFGGIGRGGAGPFFFFHWPSVDALSGDNGLTTIDGPAADPEMLELDGVMAEIEALLVEALQNYISKWRMIDSYMVKNLTFE